MKNIIKTALIIAGIAIGPGIVAALFGLFRIVSGVDAYTSLLPWVVMVIFIGSGIISGLIAIIFSERMAVRIQGFVSKTEERVSKVPPATVIFGSVGLVFGLLVAFLLCWPVGNIQVAWLSVPISIIIYIICGSLGVRIGARNAERMSKSIRGARSRRREEKLDKPKVFAPKILDTSVIIDGRIFDILKTGIMEGTIVIPEFVLVELRHIADSADSLKRNKGRRGLDILGKIQKELDIPVEISSRDYEDVPEVDAKLLHMAKELGGKVITNDFNLNKVAAVQGVEVFNINELANAVKPVMLPGEEFEVRIIKEGKENGQGIAYLDDGTMVVVENGRRKIGQKLPVVVTSVLQTAAGRMIFVRINNQ